MKLRNLSVLILVSFMEGVLGVTSDRYNMFFNKKFRFETKSLFEFALQTKQN